VKANVKPIAAVRRGPGPVGAAVILVVLASLCAFPIFVTSPYALHIMILLFLAIVQGEAWNIVGGYAGQYSVGHSAYFGAGAYGALILLTKYEIPPWYGTWAGVAAALVLALAIGGICFRLRGPYFVLASIAVAEIVRITVLNSPAVTNGAEGILVADLPSLSWGGKVVTDFSSKVPYYYMILGLAVATILATWIVQNSKLGYCFLAIREDQDAAHSLGISLNLYKNIALLLSAFFTAQAGAFYALYVRFIDPTTVLSLDLSVQIVLVAIIGGLGTIYGPMVGALVLVPLSEVLRSNAVAQALINSGLVQENSGVGVFLKEHLAHAHVLIYGILVVVVILFMPDGVLGFARKLVARKREG
jgi:branched-chain amino acid transport system permease protein